MADGDKAVRAAQDRLEKAERLVESLEHHLRRLGDEQQRAEAGQNSRPSAEIAQESNAQWAAYKDALVARTSAQSELRRAEAERKSAPEAQKGREKIVEAAKQAAERQPEPLDRKREDAREKEPAEDLGPEPGP